MLPYNQEKLYYFTYNLDTRVCVRDDELISKYCSKKVFENMPYSFAEEVVLKDDHKDYLAAYARLHDGARFVSCDYRIKETQIWSRLSLYRVDMNSPLVQGIVQDVSEHYNDIIAKAEENEKEKQQLELNSLQLLKGIKKAYDMIIFANLTQNTYQMISYDRYFNKSADNDGSFDELIDVGAKTVPDSYRDIFIKTFSRESLLKSHLDGKKDIYLEHPQYDDQGELHWAATHVLFTDNPLNDDILQITLSQNIDERIKKENENQLALQNALNVAKSANAAKSDFLSSMSHDIRTPMNAIVGMTALATQHLDDKNYIKNCLSKMALASNHLLTLINDVLDISKVESGKMTLNPIVFSLADTVANLTNIVKHQIDEKNLKFDVRVHNITKEFLFADELRLNQIFINILSNAVKYTPEGGSISMDLTEKFDPNVKDKVRLIYVVKDNGIGMSEEFQKNMFELFERAQPVKYGEIQGSGLGLTISKRMIDLMNGTITCDSQIEKGTTFTVTLDLPIAEKIMSDFILPPMDLLLIDDDEIFLESAAKTLEQMGISPECVTNGHEAIKKCTQKHQHGKDYKVVVVDWKMPELDGIETIRRIRNVIGPNTSIILTSAYEWEEIEVSAIEAGADGFISKPFFTSKLYEKMTHILGVKTEKKTECERKNWQPNVEGLNILIAEDNNLNWEIAKESLKIYQVNTVHAENGRVCIDTLRDSKDGEFDLVLMDVKMPVLNGYETTKLIRNDNREYVKNIPIIAMTADAFAEDIQRCLEVGMNAHVAKPFNIRNLLTIIDTVVHKK